MLFWTLDFLKGSPIKNNIKNIAFLNENYASEQAKMERRENMSRLINHASSTVPFYKNLNAKKFSDFPIINKNTVRENFEDFKSKQYVGKKCEEVVTSGSTGTPFRLLHDMNKRHRHRADNLYFAKKGGYDLGDKVYLLRASHSKDAKSIVQFRKKNIIPYGIMNYTDTEMDKLFSKIKEDKNHKCIVCFASMAKIIGNYLDKNDVEPLKAKIKSVITDGDSLDNEDKDKLANFFQIPVFARYGNMECGILGQQDEHSKYGYSLNWASYHYEILALTKDVPANKGELGRIVVTDFFNYSMPLIRYDTGDMAILSESTHNGEAPFFERLEGRTVDLVYNTKGEILSPYMVATKMLSYLELKQFQFAQVASKHYEFRLNPWGTFTREEQLKSESREYLGQDAKITIKYVDDIPLLSSGKRRQVVNEIKKR
ncbi:phenylacetate--CoA ligase family protein [Flagellimonas nanhaiensis]|uniref:Phenylacetate--CoA ligase family protein n=2 Tax=Flagellimonas nanhaiensis TaxID=2292706 RepID=A0A371JKW5_9FLAO|nr:phenylacetate--CoA ligase family protein [Allomuricauda nanhaiensis]